MICVGTNKTNVHGHAPANDLFLKVDDPRATTRTARATPSTLHPLFSLSPKQRRRDHHFFCTTFLVYQKRERTQYLTSDRPAESVGNTVRNSKTREMENKIPMSTGSKTASAVEVVFAASSPRKHRGNKIQKKSSHVKSDAPTPTTTTTTTTTKKSNNVSIKKIEEKGVVVKSNRLISHEFMSVPKELPKDWSSTHYTVEEIATHNKENDCWLIVRNKVYDVTSMAGQHPGSIRAIMKHAGQVADEDFDFHSPAAQKFWLKHYCIGRVEGAPGDGFMSSCVIG